MRFKEGFTQNYNEGIAGLKSSFKVASHYFILDQLYSREEQGLHDILNELEKECMQSMIEQNII